MAKRKDKQPRRLRALTRPEVQSPEPDDLIPAAKIKQLCGNISSMTLWRWTHSEDMGCPPLTKINGRLYGGKRRWLTWRDNISRQQEVA